MNRLIQKVSQRLFSSQDATSQPFTSESSLTSSQKKVVVYDCETARCLPIGEPIVGAEYCQSSDDFEDMGIAVIGAYSSWDDRYHVYLADNLADFQTLINEAQEIVGFNSLAFDDKLCVAHGIQITTTYDLMREVRVAAGMAPHYVRGVTRKGYSLQALAQKNLGYGKSGSGTVAPQLWQQGQQGKVIDYCLADVAITRQLYERRTHLIDPTNDKPLRLR